MIAKAICAGDWPVNEGGDREQTNRQKKSNYGKMIVGSWGRNNCKFQNLHWVIHVHLFGSTK